MIENQIKSLTEQLFGNGGEKNLLIKLSVRL